MSHSFFVYWPWGFSSGLLRISLLIFLAFTVLCQLLNKEEGRSVWEAEGRCREWPLFQLPSKWGHFTGAGGLKEHLAESRDTLVWSE